MSEPLRVGMIGYRNAAPYRALQPGFPVRWVSGTPSELTKAMLESRLDVCLLPSAALNKVPEVRPIGAFGIGARGHVLSVLLFCEQPLASLLQRGSPIFVTPQSTTTRALFQQLCLRDYGIAPVLVADRICAEARLLIGDEAMDKSLAEHRWPVVRDMAQWWFESTGLPFVFARWVASAAVDAGRVDQVRAWLEDALEASSSSKGRAELHELGAQAGWSPATTMLYYERLRLRLQDEDLEGLRLFQEILKGTDHAPG